MQYIKGLRFFFNYLGNKIFLALLLSFIVGFLDGLGLTMFLPLLQIVEGDGSVNAAELGRLQFVLEILQSSGIGLTLSGVLIFMVFFFTIKGVIAFAQYYYRIYLQEYFIREVRLATLNGVNSLSYKAFVETDGGRIQNTLTGEVERVSKAYQSYFLAIQSAIMVLIYVAFAFLVNIQFALLVTVGGILTNLVYRQIYIRTKGASRSLSTQTNDFQGLVIQHVANFKYLKATASLPIFTSKMKMVIDRIRDTNKRIGYLMSVLIASREPLVVGVVATVIFIQTSYFGSTLGPIIISLLFFYRALSFLMQMQTHVNHYVSVSGSLDNVEDFLSYLGEKREKSGSRHIDSFNRNLVLNSVSLSYNTSRGVHDINLQILKNETIALVGESGSGKTTLINIIAGLLPVDSGNYIIDGQLSTDIELSSFQKRIGYITQDTVIFNDTIFNNITFWAEKNEENLKRFNEALQKAAAIDFVQRLDKQEDHLLGSNGLNLSGGQKQRISIARELYKQVDILILDEATSALDSETERSIKENIDLLKGHYTVIIVAHRLSTIRHADRIVILKNGVIDKIDSFTQLMRTSDDFNRMVSLQELKP